jgi:uncharacterized protein (DUF1499 family)
MEDKQERPGRRWSRAAVAGFVLALAAGAAELLSGFGTREGLWDYRGGISLFRLAACVGIAAGLVSLAGCAAARMGEGRRGLILALAGLLIALAVVAIPWSLQRLAGSVPAIHDITTDPDDPPGFVALLAVRNASANGAAYGGPEVAAKQRKAYPDIVPLMLPLPPSAAFAAAWAAARSLEWQVAGADERAGRLEATATTFWFGFKDDVVVRVTAAPGGSRVDVRSVSRVGRSDLGANARRIRAFLKAVREQADVLLGSPAPR